MFFFILKSEKYYELLAGH